MIFLFIILILNSVTLFALAILLIRNIWFLGANVTTIEGWEIERHETLLRRAKVSGGYLDGPNGIKVKIVRQEFPYDIGIFQNFSQGMGVHVLLWLWPFAKTQSTASGLQFGTNGFEGKVGMPSTEIAKKSNTPDPWTSWPPPDPDRVLRQMREPDLDQATSHEQDQMSNQDYLEAFRQRQRLDLRRFEKIPPLIVRRRPFHERKDVCEDDENIQDGQFQTTRNPGDGEEAWRNGEGDRLDDFGVDESVEFYDEDDLPIAMILQQQKTHDTSPPE